MAGFAGPRQLTLALAHSESFARDDFLEGLANAAALSLVESWPDWPSRAVVLVGARGSGKSHLAAIWAAQSGARFLSARAIETANLPSALSTGTLVLEDMAEGQFDERALFHLLNLAREEGAYLLLTARSAPAGWTIGIPDLASRLRALPAVVVQSPDETLLRAVLVKLFADRQLAVDESLIAYILSRIERSFPAMRDAVATLDREALRRKRPVNRALAADVLGVMIP